jgi:hypothetical protein
MKKLSFILFTMLVCSLNAQRNPEKMLNVGIGIAPFFSDGIPIGVVYEVPIKNNFSIGGYLDFARYSNSRDKFIFFSLGGRGSYHTNELLHLSNDKLDTYVGATLGLNSSSFKDYSGFYTHENTRNMRIYFGLHIGARYLFADKWGGFAELGYGISALRLGFTKGF